MQLAIQCNQCQNILTQLKKGSFNICNSDHTIYLWAFFSLIWPRFFFNKNHWGFDSLVSPLWLGLLGLKRRKKSRKTRNQLREKIKKNIKGEKDKDLTLSLVKIEKRRQEGKWRNNELEKDKQWSHKKKKKNAYQVRWFQTSRKATIQVDWVGKGKPSL